MKKEQGFTLIELLIVIVILGILAGVVIAVINPARQQARANEGVLKENVAKMSLALNACVTSTNNPRTDCITLNDVGVIAPNGTPAASTYTITTTGNPITAINAVGTMGTCTYTSTITLATYAIARTSAAACVGSW